MFFNENNDTENNFLWYLACCRHDDATQLFNSLPSYENLVQYSIHNRIEIQFYNFLQEHNLISKLNVKLQQSLEDSIDNRVKRNFVINQKAICLIDAYEKNNIKYTTLKGITYSYISNKFDRTLRDIDLLVDIDHIEKAVNIAIELGFRFKNHESFSPELVLQNSYTYDIPDLIDENNVCLEIHYKILRESNCVPCMLAKKLLDSSNKIKAFNVIATVPNINVTIAHLIYHSSKKGNFDVGLISIFDFIFLMQDKFQANESEIRMLGKDIGISKEIDSFFLIKRRVLNHEEKNRLNLLQQLIFSIDVNPIFLDFYNEENFIKKIRFFFKLLFVNEKVLQREYSISKKPHILFYFKRWIRQIIQFKDLFYIILFKRKLLARKKMLLQNFYLN